MGTRLDLHNLLITIPEIGNRAYFQGPGKDRMEYPCIVYELDKEGGIHADNLVYNRQKKYTITVIDRDPESIVSDQVGELLKIKMDRHFESDNLHHFVYNLTY